MCVFGLTETHGDEAERAVRAGLDLIAAGGSAVVRPSVHAGLEWGEIFVTPSWPPAGFGVWGRPVNLAKRLCDVAGPGELQMGPGAFARTGNRVGPTQPGQRRLKGFLDPVVSHRLRTGAAA